MGWFNRLVATTLPFVPKPIVGRVAARYVAGETLADAIAVVQELNREGTLATLDVLGEEVHGHDAATAAVDEYLRAFDAIESHGLACNVSVKLTQLGLKVDEAFCRDNVERLLVRAASFGNFVRLDMEDHTTTDATLRIYRELHARHGHLGVVLQCYMRRTLGDVASLPEEGANVRLCKGIYVEPRHVAWQGYETVRANFVAALEKLLGRGVYTGIATHDEYLVARAVALVDRLGLDRERYEFQMLLGVAAELRRILVAQGHRLRVYVPYGRDWYQYSIRRLRENPAVAGHVLRAMVRGH